MYNLKYLTEAIKSMDKHTYAILIIVAVAVIAGAAVFSSQALAPAVQRNTTSTSTIFVTGTTTISPATTVLQISAAGPISVISGNVSYSYDNQTGITTITNSTNNATIGVKGGQRIALDSPRLVLPASGILNYSNGIYNVTATGNITLLKAAYDSALSEYNLTLSWNATSLSQSIIRPQSTYCYSFDGFSSSLSGLTGFTVYNITASGNRYFGTTTKIVEFNYTDLVIPPGKKGVLKYKVLYSFNTINMTGKIGAGAGEHNYITLMKNYVSILNTTTVGISINVTPRAELPNEYSLYVKNTSYNVTAIVNVSKNAKHDTYMVSLLPAYCGGANEPSLMLTIGSSAYVGYVPQRPIYP